MILSFKRNIGFYLAIILLLFGFSSFSQAGEGDFTARFALGVNNPSSDGFEANFESKTINFPTVNLGFQYMFKPKLGANLDFGYNRFSRANNTPEFKVNYSRINVQLVYNASALTSFSNRLGAFVHAGPGFSMIKPLGDFGNNTTNYLNVMGGLELHYGVSNSFSVYLDTAYIKGFAKEFNPVSNGFGSFNGDLLTVTLGVSISLDGCYFCANL